MDDSESLEGAEPAMDELLSAYRERKRRALQDVRSTPAGQEAAGPRPIPAPVVTHTYASAPVAHPPAPPMPTTPAHAVPAPEPHLTPAAPAPGAVPQAVPPPSRASSALATAPPAQLAGLGPAVRLSEALMADRAVTVRGLPAGRLVGLLVLLLGFALLVVERRSAMLTGSTFLVRGVSLTAIALAISTVGASLAVLFSLVPSRRRLAIRLASTQAEEWTQAQEQSKRLALGIRLGIALAILGLLAAAAAYALAPADVAGLLALPGLAVTAIGLVLWVVCGARRSVARRLYVQTLVLSGLERTGVGASDPRVAPVLLALDELLGALPADQVQAFLATPQAQAYLDLIDEAGRSHGP